jgi:hypothetical protein
MLEGWNYRLDPASYVKLYINKVYQDQNSGAGKYPSGSMSGSSMSEHGYSRQKSEMNPKTDDMFKDLESIDSSPSFKR